MQHWDEIRTAYQVARLGTVSGAAEVLGVHHATVIRHVDALESRLGVKLFQRHARGYTPTEAGEELMRVGQATEDQFNQLAARIKGRGESVTGELVVTALEGFADHLIPVIASFQRDHPGLSVRLLTGQRLFRLEYGEAHVAIRAGSAPEEPDNVVQELMRLPLGLYASPGYIDRMGAPKGLDDLGGHLFVGPEGPAPRAPFTRWLADRVAPEQVAFRARSDAVQARAIREGIGMGMLTASEAAGLVEVIAPEPDWQVSFWLVTHVDLHRSAKVQAFSAHLKAAAKNWGRDATGR